MSLLDKQEVKDIVSTLNCALEYGADLYVNEHQKIRHYRARSTERRRRRKNVNCSIIAMLYTYSIGNQR